MKISDVRALSADQVNDEILKLKKEQFNLRFQRATGQLEKTTRFKEVRRTIAQLLTIANERAQGKEVVARAPKAPKAKAPKAEKPAKAEAAEAAPKAKKETKAKAEPKAKTETKTATKKSAKKAED